MKFFLIMLKNLRRNLLRTGLTCAAVIVLVFVITMIWTIVAFLDSLTTEKTKDISAIVTEKWQIISQLPQSYVRPAVEVATAEAGGVVPEHMEWMFYIGTLDPDKHTRAYQLFAIATNPRQLPKMWDEYKNVDPELVDMLAKKKDGIVIGHKRLRTIQKRIGDRIKITSTSHAGIDMEFDIVGILPSGRLDDGAVMNEDYLNDALDHYRGAAGGKHPLANRRIGSIWVKVADKDAFARFAARMDASGQFTDPAVKVESMASNTSSIVEVFSGLFWFIKWVLAPACMLSMMLIISNAIAISVRERRAEMAVLKVLGFRPGQVMALVLGEALVVGVCSGLVSATLTYVIFNGLYGGIDMGMDSPAFPVPLAALWWASAVGLGTAFLGAIMPAWTARSIRVSEVFARVG